MTKNDITAIEYLKFCVKELTPLRYGNEKVDSVLKDTESFLYRIESGVEFVTLTKRMVDDLRTNGAFTNATMNHLPLPARPTTGWVKRLIGQKITRESYEKALAGRGVLNQKNERL